MKRLVELFPELSEHLDSDRLSAIESLYPHIAKKFDLLYGYQEFNNYIENDLWCHEYTPERPVRQGFPLNVLIELDVILRSHIRQFPFLQSETATREADPWAGNWQLSRDLD